MQRARMKHGERIVDGRHQPARRNILRGTRQRQSLGGVRGKHPRLTDRLVGAAVNQLRRAIGGK